MITTHQLTKQFRGTTVVKPLNVVLAEKKCIALIGPNGAGKTTTLRMLAGLMKPTAGEVRFPHHQGDYRKQIGYLPQQPVFHEWMTGEEYLIYCARLSYIPKKTAASRADSLLKQLDIHEAKNKRIGTYSGGMRQRLGIAQAIIHEPSLLILDEPVSALDPIGRREILKLMEQLKKKMTVLFSTHILSDADEVCDEVILLHQGTMVEAGSINDVREKYKTEKLELIFRHDTGEYEKALQALKPVLEVRYIRGVYHLTVSNTSEARNTLLETIHQQNWPLDSFQVNRASLEDIFMKAVQSTCNG